MFFLILEINIIILLILNIFLTYLFSTHENKKDKKNLCSKLLDLYILDHFL